MTVTRRDRVISGDPDMMQCRHNTLLSRALVSVIVSTIGRAVLDPEVHRIIGEPYMPLGHDRYYETMVWHAVVEGDAVNCDIARGAISVKSRNAISWVDDTTDALAEQMHEMVVAEMIDRLEVGETFASAASLCPYN